MTQTQQKEINICNYILYDSHQFKMHNREGPTAKSVIFAKYMKEKQTLYNK